MKVYMNQNDGSTEWEGTRILKLEGSYLAGKEKEILVADQNDVHIL